MSTGQPREDAKIAFDRERRRRVLSRLASRLRFEPDDVSHMLPFEEVVAALGATSRASTRRAGDPAGLDRRHRRPPARRVRPRLPPLPEHPRALGADRRGAQARRGDAADRRLPDRRPALRPATATTASRWPARWARRTSTPTSSEVRTKLGADRELQMRDLPLKAHERVFHERVPLPPRAARADPALRRVALRAAREPGRVLGLPRVARARASCSRGRDGAQLWFREEYEPIVDMLREAGLGGGGTETERYLRIAMLRFLLLQTPRLDRRDRRAARGRGQVTRARPPRRTR